MDFQTFLELYYDPSWGEFSEVLPSEFDVDSLYHGTNLELHYTKNPYEAIQMAMENLFEDPAYYQGTLTYQTNPRDYKTMSHGDLKREEQRLVTLIDDLTYFQRELDTIPGLEQQLIEVRRAMSPGSIHLASVVPSNTPEFAVQEQVDRLHSEIKVLQTLESTSLDVGQVSKASQYRSKKLGLLDTIEHIAPLLSSVVTLRADEKRLTATLASTNEAISATRQQLQEVTSRLSGASLDEQMRIAGQADALDATIRSLDTKIFTTTRDLETTRRGIAQKLSIIYRDLSNVGYALPEALIAPPGPIQTRVIESNITTTVTAPTGITLPAEITAVYENLSDDPTTRQLQLQLKATVQEYVEATEDREPPYVIKKIQTRMAQLHEEIERRTKKRRYY